MDTPTLTDGTTTIRALADRDVAGVLEQCLDPVSIAWTQVPVPFGVQDAVDFVHEIAPAAWADGSQWIFCVDHPLADGSRYAGNIALRDEGHGRAEIAFGAHPAARGTGAMEAGLRLLLGWGFGERDVQTVVWRANVGNWASRKLAWRLGFRVDGVLRHSQVSRGALVDAWVGTLLADEPRSPTTRWLTSPVLEGAGVRLRPVGEDDVPRVVEACSDPRTQHWLGAMPSPYTAEHALGWIEASTEKQATGRGTTWAVADPHDDRLLAAISIFDVDDDECEIGYWAHPDARGRGVVRAAVETVTSWSFADLGLSRVRIVAAVDNAASCHVAEACGFRRTGEERLATRVRTGLADVALYDVLAPEWPTRQ
ncbi:GNAT family N-acetyltransferase [Nocardioides dongxiaopingii]|uniref:GNAT family N-acetyltransferase n=1 Tax=Nocardioides dongxiaopingii TaxID=2576036 RepID=UPI0010C76857|nr:GNAT family N-acetyltransferase [Nocardioides dongxiaopingii]